LFQVGERILLRVEGERDLSDTFTVRPGPSLLLPRLGEISLAGVRRADVEPYLKTQLTRFLRDPVVQARALLRIAVLGEVERPGFYAVSADLPLPATVMLAGGPTRTARPQGIRVERGEGRGLGADTVAKAIAHNATLAELGIRSGDRIVVPRQGRRDPEGTLRTAELLIGLPAAVAGIAQLFH
jgi:protein involved in polysaccharide export with SLBB domain